MRATIRHLRIGPRKVRLVADLVRGKRVPDAIQMLSNLPKGSSEAMLKLLKSAVANAAQREGAVAEQLLISSVTVDMAPRLKRYRARAQGRGAGILKHASHITILLSKAPALTPKKSVAKPSIATPEKPVRTSKPSTSSPSKDQQPPKTS